MFRPSPFVDLLMFGLLPSRLARYPRGWDTDDSRIDKVIYY